MSTSDFLKYFLPPILTGTRKSCFSHRHRVGFDILRIVTVSLGERYWSSLTACICESFSLSHSRNNSLRSAALTTSCTFPSCLIILFIFMFAIPFRFYLYPLGRSGSAIAQSVDRPLCFGVAKFAFYPEYCKSTNKW